MIQGKNSMVRTNISNIKVKLSPLHALGERERRDEVWDVNRRDPGNEVLLVHLTTTPVLIGLLSF